MLFLFPQSEPRPNTLTEEKDIDYHRKWSRYCLSAANTPQHARFLDKAWINKRFYINDQWVFDVDLESFLKDDEGNERNRLKLTKNIIRPIVEQFRGNAVRMAINFKVQSISSRAVSRREKKLSEMFFYTEMAEGPFGDFLREKLPIGKTMEETEIMFDNLYVDQYEKVMNYLVEYVEKYNKFHNLQPLLALDLALNGIGIIKEFEYAAQQVFKQIKAENFYFDRTAIYPDLSDASYMGEVEYMTPEEIFEQWPNIPDYQKKAIENFSVTWSANTSMSNNTFNNNMYAPNGRVPVYHNYWKDTEKYEMGYVYDKFGYPHFTKINFTYPGEDKPRYTDKDLIEVNNEISRTRLKGNKKANMYIETLRQGIIIPVECLAYPSDSKKEDKKDVMLEWGIVPYQETDVYDYNHVKFPYKTYCWGYVDGEVLSPIDDVIDPQRFINRLFSIAENQVNNSRGAGTIVDRSVVDPDMGEQETLRNMNLSKPIVVDARGRGIQNVVGNYDGTVRQGTMVIFNMLDMMSKHVQDITGVNEALKGESTGSDQLVGVTQLLLQRGSLMQEPFYNAIVNIFEQMYQSIVTVGKRIYADNERQLAIATGDGGVRIFNVTKDMNIEDFRCFVTRTNTDEMLLNSGNQMLMMMLQMQLLNQEQFADLYGRSTPQDVVAALRTAAKQNKILSMLQQKDAEVQQQEMIRQQGMQQIEQEAAQEGEVMSALAVNAQEKERDRQLKLKEKYAKSLGDMAKTGQITPEEAKKQFEDLQNK